MQVDWGFIVLITLFICTFIQLIYHWFFLSRLIFHREKKTNGQASKKEPISVIICAKNEDSNLEKHLPLILEQKYSDYEVVVVNDNSKDNTENILEQFKQKYNNLNVVNLKNSVTFFKGKKLPLSVGIKTAKNNTLIFTDADCRPSSPYWLNNIQSHFSNGTELVLGYGGYEKKKGFLNSFIRFDALTVAMNYFSFALAGIPYMGVGRNLAYKKNLFFKAGGFTSHYKLESGDDDLFVNQVANSKNTALEINPKSITLSLPKTSFKNWLLQKKRHFSTGKHYKKRHKLLLGLFGASNFIFYVSLTFILFFTNFWFWGLLLLIIKMLSLMVNYYFSSKKFNEKLLFLYSPIFDIIFALLNPVIIVSDLLYKKNKWK